MKEGNEGAEEKSKPLKKNFDFWIRNPSNISIVCDSETNISGTLRAYSLTICLPQPHYISGDPSPHIDTIIFILTSFTSLFNLNHIHSQHASLF